MDIKSFVNVLDIIFIVILAYNIITGAIDGFIKSLFGFLKYIAAYIVSKMFYLPVAAYLTVNTGLYRSINDKIANIVSSLPQTDASAEGWMEKLNLQFLPNGLKTYIDELISTSQNSLQGFVEHFAENLSTVIIEVISFIFVFLLALVLWKIIMIILDKIMSLPVLNAVNSLGGMGVGLVKGLFFCVIVSTACYIIGMTGAGAFTNALNASVLAKYFYIGFILNI